MNGTSIKTMTITIEPVGPAAADVVSELGRTTFAETFARDNDPADLARYLAESFDPAVLRRELTDPASQYILMRVGGEPAGYLKLNFAPAHTEPDLPGTLEVQRIYILAKYQGLGLGRRLMDYAEAVARAHGLTALWLGVWEKNHNAITFYGRLGFVPFGSHVFTVGTDDQTDILMKRELTEKNDQPHPETT